MKAPNEIYLSPSIAHPRKPSQVWFNHEVANGVKYIRADLADLGWEDMFKIVEIDMTLFERGTTQKDVENHFKEVLRRFLEARRR